MDPLTKAIVFFGLAVLAAAVLVLLGRRSQKAAVPVRDEFDPAGLTRDLTNAARAIRRQNGSTVRRHR